MCFRLAISNAVKSVKGKGSVEPGSMADAISMSKALVVILGSGKKSSKMDEVQTTVKNLVYLQKNAASADAEIFSIVLSRLQQGKESVCVLSLLSPD